MAPAPPPLPTPANFPFQFSSGSQTSNWICDSLVGAITPAIRQKGGRLAIGLVERAGVNDPAVTDSAVVMVVCGSERSASALHAAPAVCAAGPEIGQGANSAASTNARVDRIRIRSFMVPPSQELSGST